MKNDPVKTDPKMMNPAALAYIGDAVYEVYVRDHVLTGGQTRVNRLHFMAVGYVRAASQAKALREMMEGFLTDEEMSQAKRARNHRSSSVPRHADPVDYKLATAFEALIGYLYLRGDRKRMEDIIGEAIRIIEEEIP
ncbi:MAG: Mini-ribonuclease 3 [Anaerovoracaceae bacterium]